MYFVYKLAKKVRFNEYSRIYIRVCNMSAKCTCAALDTCNNINCIVCIKQNRFILHGNFARS